MNYDTKKYSISYWFEYGCHLKYQDMYEEGSRKDREWNFAFLKYRLIFKSLVIKRKEIFTKYNVKEIRLKFESDDDSTLVVMIKEDISKLTGSETPE